MSLITERTLLEDLKVNSATIISELADITINTDSNNIKVIKTIIRPNNITAYGTNNIINESTTSTVLPKFDFTASNQGKLFTMASITMIVGDDSASTLLPIRINFYGTDVLGSQNVGDNQTCTISLADTLASMLCLGTVSSATKQSISATNYADQFQNRQFIIPSTGLVGFALISNSAFTPIANESITFELIGTLT
jgi:hypothetical protein